jgi:hypothetical protein
MLKLMRERGGVPRTKDESAAGGRRGNLAATAIKNKKKIKRTNKRGCKSKRRRLPGPAFFACLFYLWPLSVDARNDDVQRRRPAAEENQKPEEEEKKNSRQTAA